MINLVYSGNKAMFDGILSSLLSIARKTTRPLCVRILTGDFTSLSPKYVAFEEEDAKFIEKVIRHYNKDSSVSLIRMEEAVTKVISEGKAAKNRFTPYTLLRLLLDEVEGLPDRLLYLDTDILAKGDISELFDYDLRENYIGMVPDAVGSIYLSPEYCNAGMLLLDYGKIRKTNLLSLCLNMTRTKRMFMPDQTAINTFFAGRIAFLPRKFNEQKKTMEDTVLRHFCDVMKLFPPKVLKVKQWDVDRVHSVLKEHAFDEDLDLYLKLKDAYLKGEDISSLLA